MASREILSLNETTPQILAPQAGDSYLAPRPVAISIGTITTDLKVLDLSVTWNAAGVTFTGLKFNATSTASAANSLLADFQIGGSTAVAVDKAGFLLISPKASPYYIWYIDTTRFMATASASLLQIGNAGVVVDAANSKLLLATTVGFQSSFSASGSNVDVGVSRNAADIVEINNGTVGTWRDLKVRQHYVDQTITAGGTTGNQTINKAAGTVNFAAAATAITVTCSLCTTSSTIYAALRTNDATARVANVVPGAGSFVINLTAAATAETSCGFLVVN